MESCAKMPEEQETTVVARRYERLALFRAKMHPNKPDDLPPVIHRDEHQSDRWPDGYVSHRKEMD